MFDCKGIPLDRVCTECADEKRAKYNPIVFDGYTQADMLEQEGRINRPRWLSR